MPFAWTSAAVAFAFLESFVVLQAFLAYEDRFFTVAQMHQRGIKAGLPFIWHFGMWGDFVLISVVAAYVIGRYFDRWRMRSMIVSLAVGFVVAGLLSWFYTLSSMPEAHIQNSALTSAGWVHLVYMAVAIAVFTHFFFFSKGISSRLLRVVSVLLFIHVFVGTHMALGILKLFSPLDWYPQQPLGSAFGLVTLVMVGSGLVWRNFGLRWALKLFDQPERTTEQYLVFLDYVCKNVSVGYFVSRFFLAIRLGETPFSMVLIALVGCVYQLGRRSVRQELEIGRAVFPPDQARIPDRFRFGDRTAITLEVTAFMLLYLTLGWAAHCILVASACMFVTACIDLNTRRLINNNIREDFADPRYAPLPNEPFYGVIMERRVVAKWFLFELPHLQKEALRIAGCAAALAVANYSYFAGAQEAAFCSYVSDAFNCALYGRSHGAYDMDRIAYGILIGTLIVNELVTGWWRRERGRRLAEISAGA